jgi:hypothetical protein
VEDYAQCYMYSKRTFVDLYDTAVPELLEVADLSADSQEKFPFAGDGALVYHLEGDLRQEKGEGTVNGAVPN